MLRTGADLQNMSFDLIRRPYVHGQMAHNAQFSELDQKGRKVQKQEREIGRSALAVGPLLPPRRPLVLKRVVDVVRDGARACIGEPRSTSGRLRTWASDRPPGRQPNWGWSVDEAMNVSWWRRRLCKLPVWVWGVVALVVILIALGSVGGTNTASDDTSGLTRDDVAAVLYGTVTCPDDPECVVITKVFVIDPDAGILQIETSLFPDSDAKLPGLAACNAVAADLWPGPVIVLGTDGRPIALGSRDNAPICELKI